MLAIEGRASSRGMRTLAGAIVSIACLGGACLGGAFLGGACLGGCGGGASSAPVETTPQPVVEERAGPVHQRGAEEARAEVGREGGVLELANGARLEIPAGAIADDVEVVFRNGASAHVFDSTETERALGPTIEFEPAIVASGGRHFTISVPEQPISRPFTDADLALAVEDVGGGRALEMGGTHTRWMNHPARHEGNRFVAELDQLAGHRMQFGLSR